MKVRFIDGPMKDRILPVNSKVRKICFPSFGQGRPFLTIETIRRLIKLGYCIHPVTGLRKITYTIRQENGEWIGEMEE